MFENNSNVDQVLNSIISKFELSDEFRMMRTGEKYYRSENSKIMARKKLMYARDNAGVDHLIEDPYKANNKLASGYCKLLVDQKVQYCLGKPINLVQNVDLDGDGTLDQQDISGLLGKNFQKVLKKVGKDASKKCIGWAHVYVDTAGKFRVMHIPSEQVIPTYSDDDAEELEYAVRYYPVKVITDSGEIKEVTRAEVWDKQYVTTYQQDPATMKYMLYKEPTAHMKYMIMYGDDVAQEQGLSWGKVPLVPLYNNDEVLYDLQPVKNYIDVYDVVESDFANNLEDIQDIYWVLKGYNGESLDTFLNEVRKYKALKVSDEGDAHAESVDIPAEARTKMLDKLNDDIFKFGRGVDTSKTGDGNITNIVIKARFANLDLKASEFESQCEDFIDRVMWFLNRYLEITKQPIIEDYTVTFNRSLIINETELLTVNGQQQGVVSEDTRLAHHPWVEDVQGEKEKMESEKPGIKLEDNEDDGEGEEAAGSDGATA